MILEVPEWAKSAQFAFIQIRKCSDLEKEIPVSIPNVNTFSLVSLYQYQLFPRIFM